MSTFDRLPNPLQRLLRRLAPGVRISVPKALTASERADLHARIRMAYRSAIEAGGEPARVVAGLAAEFRVAERTVWRAITDSRGTDVSGHEGG